MSIHGGNIREASEKYNLPEKKIIDFSSNINPLGIHQLIKKTIKSNINLMSSYPDPEYKKLLDSLSDFYNINQKNILSGNGSSELIYLLASSLQLKKAIIIQPNFSEYELSLNKVNCKILNLIGNKTNNFKIDIEQIVKKIKNIDIIYLSNPNNPSGYIYTKKELEELLKECIKNKCFLFIDEAFLDFSANHDSLTLSSNVEKNKYLIILKTLTKFYSIPGLRLGLITGDEKIIEKLKYNQYPWSINCYSQLIGQNILHDKKFINKTIEYLNKEKTLLYKELSKIKDIKIFPSYANYILCEIISNKKIIDLEKRLAKNKIIIRNCSNYIGLNDKYFRIAVRTKKENKIIINCFKDFFNK